jgi:hypothetical protein
LTWIVRLHLLIGFALHIIMPTTHFVFAASSLICVHGACCGLAQVVGAGCNLITWTRQICTFVFDFTAIIRIDGHITSRACTVTHLLAQNKSWFCADKLFTLGSTACVLVSLVTFLTSTEDRSRVTRYEGAIALHCLALSSAARGDVSRVMTRTACAKIDSYH